MSTPQNPLSADTKSPVRGKVINLSAALPPSNKVMDHPGVYRVPRQSEDEPDLYVHLRHCKKTGRVHQCTDNPITVGLTESMRLEWAELLSRLMSAKLRPTQDGTPFVYDCVPRPSEEVDGAEQFLSDLVWLYDDFRHEEEDHYTSPAYGHDDWPYLVRRANTIRQKYNLPEQKPFTDLEWARLKGRLETIRWMRGDGWDSCIE